MQLQCAIQFALYTPDSARERRRGTARSLIPLRCISVTWNATDSPDADAKFAARNCRRRCPRPRVALLKRRVIDRPVWKSLMT